MKKMKLWLDDLRPAPDYTWTVAKNSQTALVLLDGIRKSKDMELEAISFDHDLGGSDTSRRVMYYLCEHGCWPQRVYIHSMNNVGRDYLEGMARRYGPPGVLTYW